jgi:hypothetical protein
VHRCCAPAILSVLQTALHVGPTSLKVVASLSLRSQVTRTLTSRPTSLSLRGKHPPPGLRYGTTYPRCIGSRIILSLCTKFSVALISISMSNYRGCGRDANRFGGDLIAGLTVACMLIPQSVSYATSLAKMSPVTGLVSRQLFATVLCLSRRIRVMRSATHLAVLLTVFRINTRDCIRTPWFLKAVECCTRGCPQSSCRSDGHIRITSRPPQPSGQP